MESKPMKPEEMAGGQYVCVAHGGCLHSPHITIRSNGVWVKAGTMFSSAHSDCFEAWQAREARQYPTPYVTRYSSMQVTALTPEFHERTCGYWYTVTCGSMAHTAFTTKRGLMRWMDERKLALPGNLPEEQGEFATMPITGEYRSASHMVETDFYDLEPVAITATLSNGDYTLALITEENGIRTVHTLNPNVRTRITADHQIMRSLIS